ncbi:MAG: hypothetical protein IPM17_08435 [Verrucomicrobia bacterium]|nr:hypothetical protein [Verrucomicrobiota bacterium]
MSHNPDRPVDPLWEEYAQVFRGFDDLTLARWMAQTVGLFLGRGWRASHPLMAAYRVGAQVAHDRQIWLKRLATIPAAYPVAPCCRAPLLPMLTRDVAESGLVCVHCGGTAVACGDLPADLRHALEEWAADYRPVHAVAHWDDHEQQRVRDYNRAFEDAAKKAEGLLARAACELVPRLTDEFPAVVWEDQDECLEVQPEDIEV